MKGKGEEITPSKSGLSRFSREMKQGIAEIKKQKKQIQKLRDTMFLLDVSGSMDDMVDFKRKIDHLRDVMRGYQESKWVAFSDWVEEVASIPEPLANTDMANAFRYLRSYLPLTSIILVSDGRPDDEAEARREALALHTPINIIYIGEKGDRGEQFMKELAHLTGGREITVSTSTSADFGKELETSVGEILSLPSK